MNEIMAIIYFAFYAEKAGVHDDVDKKKNSEIAEDPQLLIKFLFNEKHINADIFIVFERIMSMGIKELYGTIDDVVSIKNQLFGSKSNDKDRLFKCKYDLEKEDKDRRAKVEQMYDEERKRSAVMRRCNRIYHNFLKKVDPEIYKHLTSIGLDPELQFMRWFRCILSREFTIDISINLWDFIFSGVKESHRVERDFGDMYYIDGYSESLDDPLIHLDYLCLAMIENIRGSLHKQDLGSWLEVFYNYPEVYGASKLISIAGKIEKSVETSIQESIDTIKKSTSFDSTVEESKIDEGTKELNFIETPIKEVEPIKEVVKEKPKFFDPLSDPSLMNKLFTPNSSQKQIVKNEQKEAFPSKRIAERKRSESIEDLDNSPKRNITSTHHEHIRTAVSAKETEIKNPLQEKRKNKFDNDDENEDDFQDNFIDEASKPMKANKNQQDSSATNNIMNYLSEGINLIKETKKQYVDPLVKTGVDKMTKKWAHSEENNDSEEQQQKVLREKLQKIKEFLENLKEGTHIERNHKVYINTEVDEAKLHDVETEIETIIQMTYF